MQFLARSKRCWGKALVAFLLCGLCGLRVWALDDTTPTTSARTKPAPPLDSPVAVKDANPPSTEDQAKGDPGGSLTGTVNDVAVSDSKKGLTLGDALNQIGQNKVAINFVWTLITGFLVMFMQAGFALVETGLCRAKNANHTMMMNFMVYGFGLFAYLVCRFALQMGGVGPYTPFGCGARLSGEFVRHWLCEGWGPVGTHGFFLTQGGTYYGAVM